MTAGPIRVGVAMGVRGRPRWTVPDLAEQWQAVLDRGVRSAWFAQGVGADALTLIGAWGGQRAGAGAGAGTGGPEVGPEVGTAVIPAQTRHPLVLAGQVATTAALAGPFTLGLGLGHRELLGPQFGLGGPRRVDWLREYLDVLEALLRGDDVDHRGPHFTVRARLALPPTVPPDVVLAAFGPRMLDLVAERAAGTALWRTGPAGLARDVVPVLAEAAGRHGRPMPRVLVGLPLVVTDRPEEARAYVDAAEQFSLALPTYRDAYAREGVDRPSDIALIGTEEEVREKVAVLADAGATDLVAVLHDVGDRDRTWDLLAALAALAAPANTASPAGTASPANTAAGS
ncbi:MAG TPA: LLM class flavin-dependent oxidoreductase [Acidimicrobiales bacterium]|nr:LLM class flavin-dependent oxidoreductase [Acidimicrobiales bacterium]